MTEQTALMGDAGAAHDPGAGSPTDRRVLEEIARTLREP